MAEKISDNLLFAAALGAAVTLFVVSENHERRQEYWRRIHMYRKHAILNGLKAIHHGLIDLEHHDRKEGIELIEQGAEQIQRVEFQFPRHDLYPHPGRHHHRVIGHIMQPHIMGPQAHPVTHTIHSHYTPIQHRALVALYDNSQTTLLGIT